MSLSTAKAAVLTAALTTGSVPAEGPEINIERFSPVVSRDVVQEAQRYGDILVLDEPQDPVKPAAPEAPKTTEPPAPQAKNAEAPSSTSPPEAPKAADANKSPDAPTPGTTPPAAENKTAEKKPDTAPKPDPTPEEIREVSAQIRANQMLKKEIYDRVKAGKDIQTAIKEAQEKLRLQFEANKMSLDTLEAALKDPNRLDRAQDAAKADIDRKAGKLFELRKGKLGRSGDVGEATGYCDDLEGSRGAKLRSYPELRGAVEAAKATVREKLGLKVESDGTVIDTLPKIYDTDQKLHSQLTISTSMPKPSEGVKPEEAKALLDKDLKPDPAVIARVKEAKETHETKLAELKSSNPDAAKQLEAAMALAKDVAKQSQIMELRGVVSGVDYRPETVLVLGKLSEVALERSHNQLKADCDALVKRECAELKAQWPAKESRRRN